MVFNVTKVSDWGYRQVVDIKTLEELILFMEFCREDVIIYRPTEEDSNYELCIYDLDSMGN